jgi:hypothetical protein
MSHVKQAALPLPKRNSLDNGDNTISIKSSVAVTVSLTFGFRHSEQDQCNSPGTEGEGWAFPKLEYLNKSSLTVDVIMNVTLT